MWPRMRGNVVVMSEPIYTTPSCWGPLPTSYTRNAASMTVGNAPLDEQRDAMLADLDQVVPIVSHSYFQNYILPEPPCKNDKSVVRAVLKLLKTNGTIVGGRWKYWPKDPRDLNGTAPGPQGGRLLEDKVFEPFKDLVEAIQTACTQVKGGPTREQCVKFQCNPSSIPESISRNEVSKSKPDSYGLLMESSSPVRWCDVVTPGEFKKRDTPGDKLDNYKKVLWTMCYMMQEDARRRFVIGFTIENVSMRLWFLSRSEALVTEEFDFMANHGAIVDFVLRMSFSTAAQLGFDETMTRRPWLSRIDKSVVYDIDVWDDTTEGSVVKTYRTRRLISELGAISPRGRGTRVWEVDEIDKDSGKVIGISSKVLKDVWADLERPTEGKIVKDIKKKAILAGREADFKNHFLETDRYGHVYISDGPTTREDTTNCFIPNRKRAKGISSTAPTLRVVANSGNRIPIMTAQGPVAGDGKDLARLPTEFSRYPVKVHHRIIYSEVGTPIFQAPTLRDVFMCVGEVLQRLLLMHDLGWVHRDISYGNVLIVNGKGKLTDLEYAKEESDFSGPHGIRTGTPFFMSHEVEGHRYKHLPYTNAEDGRLNDPRKIDFRKRNAANAMSKKLDLTSQPGNVPFRHNPLHDLESLLLLCIFLLLAAEFKKRRQDTARRVSEFKKAQDKLFAFIFLQTKSRDALFDGNTSLRARFAMLHPTIAEISGYLDPIADRLRSTYHAAEADMTPSAPIPFTVGGHVAAVSANQLLEVITVLENHDLQLLNENKLRPHGPAWKVVLGVPDHVLQPGPPQPDASAGSPTEGQPDPGTEAEKPAQAASEEEASVHRGPEPATTESDPPRRSLRIATSATQNALNAQSGTTHGTGRGRSTNARGTRAIAHKAASSDVARGTHDSQVSNPADAGPSSLAKNPQPGARERVTRATSRSQASKPTDDAQAAAPAVKVTRGGARGKATRPARGRGRGRGF